MRGWGFGGGDCFVDWGAEAAGFEGGSELFQERGDDLCFLRGRPGAQRRAEYFQMAAEYRTQIDFRMRSLHHADQNEAAAVRERFEIPGQVRAADAIENHLDA